MTQAEIRNLPDAGLDMLLSAALTTTAPAIVLAVMHGGQRIYHRAWGDAELGTYFDLASITKTFAATAFLSLVNAGKVKLDSPVVDVIPEFGEGGMRAFGGGYDPHTKLKHPTPPDKIGQTVAPAQVTFRQLLMHTSGLPAWMPVFELTQPPPTPTSGLAERIDTAHHQTPTVQTVYDSPFIDHPGESFCYSDLGFMLLGEAIMRLHGTSLDTAIRDLVTEPLGLQTLTFNPVVNGIPREQIAPTEYDADWRGERVWGYVHDENAYAMRGVSGHAGLFGTAADVARFGQAWLHPDRYDWAINDDIRKAAWTDTGNKYGLGWVHYDGSSYGHTGFTGTLLRLDPQTGLVIALLTNRVYYGRERAAINTLQQNVWDIIAREVAA